MVELKLRLPFKIDRGLMLLVVGFAQMFPDKEKMLNFNPIPHWVFWIWRGLPAYKSVISKGKDLKFAMLK